MFVGVYCYLLVVVNSVVILLFIYLVVFIMGCVSVVLVWFVFVATGLLCWLACGVLWLAW